MRTVWEGSFFVWHSLAQVNRELAFQLGKLGAIDAIAALDRDKSGALVFPHGKDLKKLDKKVKGSSLRVRHTFPPNLAPSEQPFILMQPWEFLRAPNEWANAVAGDAVAELWVNSHFTRNSYVLSGAPADKVKVLPLGFDPSVFKPEGSRWSVGEEGEFRILYCGGTIERKGIDVLMRAYLAEFTRSEPVRLIIKDTGSRHVYIHNNQLPEIRKFVAEPSAPRISLIEDDLSPADLAAMMRSCHVVAQPYRAEGFCLPVLEGMACGLAPIVTYGGPTDDLVLHSCGWKISSQRVQIGQIPGLEARDDQGWLEPDIDDLRQILREAFEDRNYTSELGRAAASVAQAWTWEAIAPMYARRIEAVKAKVENPEHASKAASISLCMIVKNEERVIADCLASVKGHFDELIVVDTGSTDGTQEICESFGVDLRHYPWTDSFADARNQSMKDAKSDWLMWIDADDTVSIETLREVRQAVAMAPADVIGFVVPVRFLEEQGHGTQVDHVKVFRNLPGLEWEGRIHEQILPSLRRAAEAAGLPEGGRISRLRGFVLHSGYDTSEQGQARKRERDEKLLKLDLKERPNHPFVLFNLGMTAHYTDDHQGAVKWFERCLKHSQVNESHVRKAYALYGASLKHLGEMEKAKDLLEKGLRDLPEDPEIMFHLAQIESASGNHQGAIEYYNRVLKVDISGYFTSLDPGILGYKTRHNLALAYLALDDYAAARDQWVASLEESPKPEVAFTLFDAALSRHDLETAKRMLAWTLQTMGQGESWANMTIKLADLVGMDALPQLEQALNNTPANLGLRKVYATHLLHRDKAEQAIPHLYQLQAEGIPDGAFFLGVLSEQQGDQQRALGWYRRAYELNPRHQETADRIALLGA